jgi:anti-sigma B factor antagonist
MSDLSYESKREGGVLRLSLHGELDMRVAPTLRQALRTEIARGGSPVIVDLGDVPFLDSSIIATLVEALRNVRARGGTLEIRNCQPGVRDTFEIARLVESFGIETT